MLRVWALVGRVLKRGAGVYFADRMQAAAGGAPAIAVFANPVQQGSLEADVVAQSFGLDPLVPQDLFALGKKLLVKAGLLHEVVAPG